MAPYPQPCPQTLLHGHRLTTGTAQGRLEATHIKALMMAAAPSAEAQHTQERRRQTRRDRGRRRTNCALPRCIIPVTQSVPVMLATTGLTRSCSRAHPARPRPLDDNAIIARHALWGHREPLELGLPPHGTRSRSCKQPRRRARVPASNRPGHGREFLALCHHPGRARHWVLHLHKIGGRDRDGGGLVGVRGPWLGAVPRPRR